MSKPSRGNRLRRGAEKLLPAAAALAAVLGATACSPDRTPGPETPPPASSETATTPDASVLTPEQHEQVTNIAAKTVIVALGEVTSPNGYDKNGVSNHDNTLYTNFKYDDGMSIISRTEFFPADDQGVDRSGSKSVSLQRTWEPDGQVLKVTIDNSNYCKLTGSDDEVPCENPKRVYRTFEFTNSATSTNGFGEVMTSPKAEAWLKGEGGQDVRLTKASINNQKSGGYKSVTIDDNGTLHVRASNPNVSKEDALIEVTNPQ